MRRKDTFLSAGARLAGCALPACLLAASGCGKPYLILRPEEGSYHVKVSALKDDGSPSGEVVERDLSSSPSQAAVEVPLKGDGLHRVEVKNATGSIIANFDMNLYGQKSTQFRFSKKEVKVETLPRGFTITSPLTLFYGLTGIVLLTLGGIQYRNAESSAAQNGTCVDAPVPPVLQCREIYSAPPADTSKLVGGLLMGGSGVALGLAILAGIPEWRARHKKLWAPVMRVSTGGLNP